MAVGPRERRASDDGFDRQVVVFQQYPMSESVRPMSRLLVDSSGAPRAQKLLDEIYSHAGLTTIEGARDPSAWGLERT